MYYIQLCNFIMKKEHYIRKVSCFQNKIGNVNVASIQLLCILHKTLSTPLLKSLCILKSFSLD